MKKEFLHKRLDGDSPGLKGEIEKSLDLGGSVSVGPSHTFFYSRETGCRPVENAQLDRVYAALRIGRPSVCCLVFETKDGGRTKLPGTVDFCRLRAAYDKFCPQVLIGEKGRELSAEKLELIHQRKRRALYIAGGAALLWMTVSSIGLRWGGWPGLTIAAAACALMAATAVWCIRFMTKN